MKEEKGKKGIVQERRRQKERGRREWGKESGRKISGKERGRG
jgi:hypothetical protein